MRQSCANHVYGGATTMSIDKKQLSKLVYYMTTFDGGIYYNGKNAKFMINMKSEHKDYLNWVKNTMSNITSVQIKDLPNYNKDGFNRKPLSCVWTKTHPYFTRIRERVYISNHKVIDPHMLTLMDAEALAIIFMTDGSSSLDNRWSNPHCKIDLCTKGFSYADNMSLSKSIYNKLNIRSNIHRHNKYWYLNIPAKDHIKFVDTIKPYIVPSFFYKLERIAPALDYKRRPLDDDIV